MISFEDENKIKEISSVVIFISYLLLKFILFHLARLFSLRSNYNLWFKDDMSDSKISVTPTLSVNPRFWSVSQAAASIPNLTAAKGRIQSQHSERHKEKVAGCHIRSPGGRNSVAKRADQKRTRNSSSLDPILSKKSGPPTPILNPNGRELEKGNLRW